VYVDAAREDVTIPLHPLTYATEGEAYYRTARAAELILRGWDQQDLSQTPRLMRWLFNAMYAATLLGLAIADTAHLVFPGSDLHKKILACLPEALRTEWQEIMRAPGKAAEQLEAVRNRLKPIFDSSILRAMFSSSVNRFDVGRWMDEGKIVVVDLSRKGRIPDTMSDLIGGMVVNEVLNVASAREPGARRDTILVLDEFQRFVKGNDLEYALAESRQMKVNLVLSHQSFSQLKSETVDLTSLIFQAQNRLIFRLAGFDASVVASELAALTFDPLAVKDEIHHRCQRVSGHRVAELHSRQRTEQLAQSWSEQFGESWSEQAGKSATSQENVSKRDGSSVKTLATGEGSSSQKSEGKGGSEARSQGGSTSRGTTEGTSESLVPVYEEYTELASRTFWTFDEKEHEWGKKVRQLRTGQCVLQLVDDDALYRVAVERTAPGYLDLDWEAVVRRRLPRAVEAFEQLLELNFRREWFVTPAQLRLETAERLQKVLVPRLELGQDPADVLGGAAKTPEPRGEDDFA
jgi:hypothetical protein